MPKADAIEIRGSNYYFDGQKVGNGKDAVTEALREDSELCDRITTATLDLLKPSGGQDKDNSDSDEKP